MLVAVYRERVGLSTSGNPPIQKKTTEWDEIKFFADVNKEMKRDYTLIIDQSGSMSSMASWSSWFKWNTRWSEAKDAVQYLAPHITKLDPDGVKVFFFNHNWKKYENIRTAGEVMDMFSKERPGGSTDLAKVLKKALEEHFESGKDETILVVTDGQPNSEPEVKDVIIKATKKMKLDSELSISFIQIGDDYGAAKFLQALDDDLQDMGAKFDIVDTLTTTEMKGMSFSTLVQKSILD